MNKHLFPFMKHEKFLDFSGRISYNQELWFTFHEPAAIIGAG
jgi:hypothetical protein